jgi:hypothetical protein
MTDEPMFLQIAAGVAIGGLALAFLALLVYGIFMGVGDFIETREMAADRKRAEKKSPQHEVKRLGNGPRKAVDGVDGVVFGDFEVAYGNEAVSKVPRATVNYSRRTLTDGPEGEDTGESRPAGPS